MIPQEMYDILRAEFDDAVLGAQLEGVLDPELTVSPERVQDVARFLRDEQNLQFDTLMCLTGMDYTGGKLGVVYHLASIRWGHKIVLKTEVTAEHPHCRSVESVWKTANWHEREAFDMFGIIFDGHPDLRRILNPYDWEGYPLRKDYKVPEFYNGMRVPY